MFSPGGVSAVSNNLCSKLICRKEIMNQRSSPLSYLHLFVVFLEEKYNRPSSLALKCGWTPVAGCCSILSTSLSAICIPPVSTLLNLWLKKGDAESEKEVIVCVFSTQDTHVSVSGSDCRSVHVSTRRQDGDCCTFTLGAHTGGEARRWSEALWEHILHMSEATGKWNKLLKGWYNSSRCELRN